MSIKTTSEQRIQKSREASRRWRIKNPEKNREHQRLYRKKNREKVREMKKRYKHKELEYKLLYNKTPRGKYQKYKSGARRRSHTFGLTLKDFETFWGKPCHYCGASIETIGLDRKNNNLGYIIENVVSCCTKCNDFKRRKSYDNFMENCIRISKHLSKVG